MSTTQQPEALHYAEILENFYSGIGRIDATGAAAELRRLHAENTALQAGYAAARLEIESLRAQGMAPAGEYPALPEASAKRYGDFGFPPELLFTDAQMEEYVDADRAMRAAQPAGAQQPGAAYAALPYKQALGSTNCMQCCVSYMMGLPLENIPDFATDGGWERFSDFAETQGYVAVMLPGNREYEADYLASGTTARGTSHMVVMNDGKLVHDPHPSNAGLVDVQCVWLLAKRASPTQGQQDEHTAFEASAKTYTSNVSFERDASDYVDMTASLLWHGWKLRASHAQAPAQAAPAAVAGPLNELEELNLLNKLITLGSKAAHAHAQSNSDDGHKGTAAYVQWQEMRAEMGELIRAAYAAPTAHPAPQQETQSALFDKQGFRAWVLHNLPDDTIIGSSAYWADHLSAWAQRFVKKAPQQEAQEPHGWLYEWTHSSATGKPDATYTAFTTDEAHASKHDNCRAVYTAPHPAPASQDEALDAARYRYLTRSMGDYCITHAEDHLGGVLKAGAADAAIDASRKEKS